MDTRVTSDEDGLARVLRAFDALLHCEILRLQARYKLSLDEFRGLYISNEQVDALARQLREERGQSEANDVELRLQLLSGVTQHQRLSGLADCLGLSDVEVLILLFAAAPALDSKYETLYAYLNNDVTQKRLSVDLALRLAAGDRAEALCVRAALAPDSALTASGLLQRPFEGGSPGLGIRHALEAHSG
jgi:hypothetical protein